MRRQIKGWLGIAVLWAGTSVWGTTVRVLNLMEMVTLADRIFWGRCLAVEPIPARAGSVPAVEYLFEVRQGIKGVQSGETVRVRQVGAGQGGTPGISGVPRYRKGQQVLLFLHADSPMGLTSPVGLLQGVFELQRTSRGEMTFINRLRNRNLVYQLSERQASEAGIAVQELRRIEEGEPLDLDFLVSLVERVERFHFLRGRVP